MKIKLASPPPSLEDMNEFRRWIKSEVIKHMGIPIVPLTSEPAEGSRWSGHIRTAQPVRPWRPRAKGQEIPIDDKQTLIIPEE
jgi:hypothetical protein